MALIVVILYATKRSSGTFTDYAVGGRSFSAWFIAMSYTSVARRHLRPSSV